MVRSETLIKWLMTRTLWKVLPVEPSGAEHENLPIEHEEREARGNYSEEQSNDQRKVSDDLLPERDRSDKQESDCNEDRYAETAVDESNGVTESAMVGKGEKPGLPCEGWWKRQKVMHSQPNGNNAILTVAIAATLMGFLIVGKRLQKVVPSATFTDHLRFICFYLFILRSSSADSLLIFFIYMVFELITEIRILICWQLLQL